MSENKLASAIAYVRGHITYFKILMVFLSVGIPLVILYCLDPASFDKTFNGRAYFMFFVWLLVLEFALDWDKYGLKTSDRPLKSKLAFGIAFALPTCYVIAANFFGLNGAISELTRWSGIISPTVADYTIRLEFTPLASEFLAFAALFAIVILCMYRLKGLKDFLLPIAMLVAIGSISMINLLFPFGDFTPFQILVPATTTLATGILSLIGYHTYLVGTRNYTPTVIAYNSTGQWGAQIAWPCAGVDSLIIYTVVILLFMKKATIPRLHKVIYFVVGAVVTYFINVLRVVLIFVIGVNGGDVWVFHDNYAQLLSITWIVCYPLIIIGSRVLWSKLRHRNPSSAKPIAKLNSGTADLALG